MILDSKLVSREDLYRFLTAVVVPRPIAFVSTLGRNGRRNVAPFSFFNAISSAPPLIGIAFSDRTDDPKDTLRNIRDTQEFVVNVVSEPLLEAMVRTAGEWPSDVDEFEVVGLTVAPSKLVKAPRVAESPVHLECRFEREIALGNSVFVVGEVLIAEADDAFVVDGRVDTRRLQPIGRLGGENYSRLRDVVSVPRPRISRATGLPKA